MIAFENVRVVKDRDLEAISRERDFELEPTESLRLPSFDGVDLYVEVTLPKGPGPWPTIGSSSSPRCSATTRSGSSVSTL